MRATWFIALREVRERMRMFAFAAVLAVLPFAATLLPGARQHAYDTISILGRSLSAIFGIGLAIMLGASVSRDLVERRMSFYFSRPMSAASIWIGRAVSSLFLAFACYAIIAVPSMLVVPRGWIVSNADWTMLALLTIAVLFFVIHILSTMLRSRSVLLALDFVFVIGALVVLYLIARPLYLGLQWAVSPLLVATVVGVFAVIAIAPVWQLANGRSDIRRSHAALMRFLWPGIAVVLLIAGGVVAWVVSVPPSELSVGSVEQAQRGPLVMISGVAERRFDFQASYLLDSSTGRYTRIGVPLYWGSQFSDDGRVAAWLEPVGLFAMRALELHTNLHGATGIEVPYNARFELSPDGRRVAISEGEKLTVYDLESAKLLSSAVGLSNGMPDQLFFVTPDLVRVIEHDPRVDDATVRIFELDIRTRKFARTGELHARVGSRFNVTVSGDGSRMFICDANVIADGRTGATLATLDLPGTFAGAMLHDGGIAVTTRGQGGAQLHLFDRDGKPQHDLAFPQHRIVFLAAETTDGKLILAAPGTQTVIVDAATGKVERTVRDLRGPASWWSAGGRLRRFAADQELVASNGNGELLLWKNEGRTEARPLFPSR